MKNTTSGQHRAVAILSALFLLFGSRGGQSAQTAQMILKNADIYTMDSTRSWADAVAIADGKIIYVGTVAGVGKFKGPETKILDLKGRMILPGFHDSHIHLISGGMDLATCTLNGILDQEEAFERIRDYVKQHPEKKWIIGNGWELPLFPDANPSKEQLDKLIPDQPAYLTAMDGHSVWVNSRALQIAGITKDTPDPVDGRIERKKETGEPSGALRESAADLVAKFLPKDTHEDRIKGLEVGLSLANSFGITSIVEANAGEEFLQAYSEFDRKGKLSVRVLASQSVDTQKGIEQITDLIKRRDLYQGKYLHATMAKIFADGVIESKTAALLEPYLDRPGYRGMPNLDAAQFNRLAIALDAAGFQIHVHAIGDAAIRMSLDAIEAAERANGRRDARHQIIHLELINPLDIPRFRKLGVVANFQGFWAFADPYITQLTEPALGPERSRWLYPIGSVFKSGAVIAGGSDWDVSSMNPLDAIQVAVTRRDVEDATSASWIPEEIMDLPSMLAAYTINGAYVSHQEKITGSIEVGKSADLTILDKNLFEIPLSEIHKVKVLSTLLEGKEVYKSEASLPRQ